MRLFEKPPLWRGFLRLLGSSVEGSDEPTGGRIGPRLAHDWPMPRSVSRAPRERRRRPSGRRSSGQRDALGCGSRLAAPGDYYDRIIPVRHARRPRGASCQEVRIAGLFRGPGVARGLRFLPPHCPARATRSPAAPGRRGAFGRGRRPRRREARGPHARRRLRPFFRGSVPSPEFFRGSLERGCLGPHKKTGSASPDAVGFTGRGVS